MKSKQIAVPDFMSPPQAVQNLQARLDGYVTKLRQTACKNANIKTVPASYDEETKMVHPGDVVFSDEACKNQRRNGSKFCQECSDKHHGVNQTCHKLDDSKPETCPANCKTHGISTDKKE